MCIGLGTDLERLRAGGLDCVRGLMSVFGDREPFVAWFSLLSQLIMDSRPLALWSVGDVMMGGRGGEGCVSELACFFVSSYSCSCALLLLRLRVGFVILLQ